MHPIIHWPSAILILGIGTPLLTSSVLAGPAHAENSQVVAAPGQPSLFLGAYQPASLGYTAEEWFVSGDATSYASKAVLAADGRWAVAPADTRPYSTRIVVMRPTDPAKFNGTVLVEWLNVSGGADAPAEWMMAHREIVRGGYAYVAVSAQKVGVEGGASLTGIDRSLKKIDPARYGRLSHPGDAFAFDIFSQAGNLVRRSGPDAILGPLAVKHVIAVGESQSAHFLTTYVNAVDPIAKVYDGFLIHSRFAGSAPLDGSSIMEATAGPHPPVVKFRPDLRVPVVALITETDLLGGRRPGYYMARQPDNRRLRVWDVGGTAHADTYTIQAGFIDTGMTPLDKIAAAYAPTRNLMDAQVDKPINSAPQHHYVLQAALSNLDRWVRTGKPAPKAPRLSLTKGAQPTLIVDSLGLATGGVRTPWIDVPVMRTSGVGNSGNAMAAIFGSSEPFDPATIGRLYPGGKTDYLKRFETALDSAIAKGFILQADREEILALAALMYPDDQGHGDKSGHP